MFLRAIKESVIKVIHVQPFMPLFSIRIEKNPGINKYGIKKEVKMKLYK